VTAKSIDNTALTVYGKRVSGVNVKTRTINSYITVVGEQHGPTINIPATYTSDIITI
jgi:hypothetical protein